MRVHTNILFGIFLSVLLLLVSNNSSAYHIIKTGDTLTKDTSGTFVDDPIAAMLDSLSRLKFFDKATLQTNTNKYHFPIRFIVVIECFYTSFFFIAFF